MSANPMGPMGDQGDPGDESDSKWQQCEQEIEDLESRVAALEAKAGISSPADEPESRNPSRSTKAPSLIANNKQPGGHGSVPFFGGYK